MCVGTRWCIGSVTTIPILDKPWLLNGGCIDNNFMDVHHVQNVSVYSQIDNSSKMWNQEILNRFSALT